MVEISNVKYNKGDMITFLLHDGRTGIGRIYYDPSTVKSYYDSYGWVPVYICNDNPELSGERCDDRMGYPHSWQIRISINGEYSDNTIAKIIPLINGLKLKKFNISRPLMEFYKLNELDQFIPLFEYNLGIFDEFDSYEVSPTSGFIVLRNSRKNMEIKLGRFIRQMALRFNEIVSVSIIQKLEVTDQLIEKIHNKFVSYQEGDNCVITLLNGEDIEKGYTRTNYLHTNGGTLHNSCMTDKFDYIELYRKNPNQINLAVMWIGDKVAARSLVWTDINGKQYCDRVYYKYDWLENLMIEKLRKQNIEPIYEKGIRVIQLENWKFDSYPYIDNFYYMDKETGTLVSLNNPKTATLRNTNGAG
jgi:hypothetical protein